jgi:hypothetical protein
MNYILVDAASIRAKLMHPLSGPFRCAGQVFYPSSPNIVSSIKQSYIKKVQVFHYLLYHVT